MKEQIETVIERLFNLNTEVVLSRPSAQFGDMATNVALQLAGKVGEPPRSIAEKIVTELKKNEDIKDVTIAGPGFINIHLSDAALIRAIYAQPIAHRDNTVAVIETNNPNPFKPMHIGHAFNAVLADTMANLLAVSGAKTHRVSYHGDVGTHVGKSMWAILRYCDGDVNKLRQIPPKERNEFMGKMYAEGAAAAKSDPEAKEEIASLAAQSFTRDDPQYHTVYGIISEWSYQEIDHVVARLGNIPIEKRYVESATEEPGKRIIVENTPRVFTKSDGAYVFEGSKYGSFDNVYIASNGNGLYGAHDMGLIQLKYADYPTLDQCIVVTADEQAAYFKGVIAASELVIPELSGKLANFSTGVVKLSTGKMSSRTGDVVTIGWLFDEFAQAIIARGGSADSEIVSGALRYQFLKTKIGSDVTFDVNEAVSLTGNTGSYLQYAHARARRILEKATSTFQLPREIYDEDRALVRKLGEYAEVVTVATRALEPHHICTYLFELAQEFNRYYENNQVVGDTKEHHRVSLVTLYADTLRAGLLTLGIHAPDTM